MKTLAITCTDYDTHFHPIPPIYHRDSFAAVIYLSFKQLLFSASHLSQALPPPVRVLPPKLRHDGRWQSHLSLILAADGSPLRIYSHFSPENSEGKVVGGLQLSAKMEFDLVPRGGRGNYTGFMTKSIVYTFTFFTFLVGMFCSHIPSAWFLSGIQGSWKFLCESYCFDAGVNSTTPMGQLSQ
jgi:hypothetical protein